MWWDILHHMEGCFRFFQSSVAAEESGDCGDLREERELSFDIIVSTWTEWVSECGALRFLPRILGIFSDINLIYIYYIITQITHSLIHPQDLRICIRIRFISRDLYANIITPDTVNLH